MKPKISTRNLVLVSILTAISVVLSRFVSIPVMIYGIKGINFGIGMLPVIFSGFITAPVYGAICGAVADIVGYLIKPEGAYFPLFTITSALAGFLPAFLMRVTKKRTDGYTFVSLLLCIAVSQTITSIALNSLWLTILFGRAFFALLLPRAISQLVLIPVFATLCYYMLRQYKKSFGDL